MNIVLPLLPVLAMVCVVFFRDQKVVRYVAVAFVLITAFVSFPVAPHRLAALSYQSPQGEDWWRGALDTRNAIYPALPTLATAFIALAVLAILPSTKK